jgi:hypothetical protein
MYPEGPHQKSMLLSCFLAASLFLSSLACASSEFHFVEPPSTRHVAAGATGHEPCADNQTESEFCSFLRQQLTSLQSLSNKWQAVALSQLSALSISTEQGVLPAVLAGSATELAAFRPAPQLSPQSSNVVLRI